MYTGQRIQGRLIIEHETETVFRLNGDHIYGPDQPTGYYLADGLLQDVKHVYGPTGYTKFYVQDGHIYGPSPRPPWTNGHHPGLR